MFTGLVEETGALLSFARSSAGARLTIQAREILPGLRTGDSVAVNGCCLTATEFTGETIAFDLLAETLRRTNLGDLNPGAPVNLERALPANGRLGGHFVQGHIDATVPILDFSPHGADYRLEVALPAEYAEYVIPKGSICLDGISLTVAELLPASCVLWIIPHTLQVTNLHTRRAGDLLNVEYDLLAKHVSRIVALRAAER